MLLAWLTYAKRLKIILPPVRENLRVETVARGEVRAAKRAHRQFEPDFDEPLEPEKVGALNYVPYAFAGAMDGCTSGKRHLRMLNRLFKES